MTYPSILPFGSTQLELALEQVGHALLDIPAPIRDVWSPDNCPRELLPWLAWGLSIDTWSSDWPEAVMRSRVRQAIAIQRRKGTVASVRDVVESFAGEMAIREWWQIDPRGEPHTFEIVLSLSDSKGAFPADYIDTIIAEIARTKPVRSHFTFSQGLNAVGSIAVAAAARPTIFARLQLPTAALSLKAAAAMCAAARPVTFTRLTASV